MDGRRARGFTNTTSTKPAVAPSEARFRGKTLRKRSYATLVRQLRENLGLTGMKIGCEEEARGTRTVLVDGRPVLSCMTLATGCDGKSITTIERPTDRRAGELYPPQHSFIDHTGRTASSDVAEAAVAGSKPLSMNGYKTEGTKTLVKRALLEAILLSGGVVYAEQKGEGRLERVRHPRMAVETLYGRYFMHSTRQSSKGWPVDSDELQSVGHILKK